jgi:hypothetical protein
MGVELPDLITDLTIYRVVVFAAQPVIPDPSRVRPCGVDLGLRPIGDGRIVCHGEAPMSARCLSSALTVDREPWDETVNLTTLIPTGRSN